jgi:branched-chain amino acid aminotransferase
MLLPFWFNGVLHEEPVIALAPSDRGFLLGDGAFETLPVFAGMPVDLDCHVMRLMGASAALGLGLDRTDVEQAVNTLMKQHAGASGIMRITSSRGVVARDLAADSKAPNLLITLSNWNPGTLFQPVTLITSSVRRNSSSPASAMKVTSYIDNILAAREASAASAGDALMLNEKGNVACTTISNIFAMFEGHPVTPPLSDGVLPGIIRHHIGAAEASLSPQRLREADGVFLTNSIRLVRPVISLDGLPFPSSSRERIASIFEELCRRIEVQCGLDPRVIDKG